MKISKVDFPTLPNRGASLRARAAEGVRGADPHDRRSTGSSPRSPSPASSRPRVEVQNNPPQVLVSYSPAILVPIDGAPVMKPVPSEPRF